MNIRMLRDKEPIRARRCRWSMVYRCFNWVVVGWVLGSWCLCAEAASGPVIALDAISRATYDLCLYLDVPIGYAQLTNTHKDIAREGSGVLQECANLLTALGFRCRVQEMSLSELHSLSKAVIVVHSGMPQVMHVDGDMAYLREYPREERHILLSELGQGNPVAALAVEAIPVTDAVSKTVNIRTRVKDFGIIDEGDIVETTTVLYRDTCNGDLGITRMWTNCGCTTISGSTERFKCQEMERLFQVRFESKGKAGYQEYLCCINTTAGPALFRLSGFVRSKAGYYPTKLDYGTVAVNASAVKRQIVFISPDEIGRRPVISVEAVPPLSCEIEAGQDRLWGVPADNVCVTLNPQSMATGLLKTSIRVVYRYGTDKKEVAIPIEAYIVPAIKKYYLVRLPDSTVGKPTDAVISPPWLKVGRLVNCNIENEAEVINNQITLTCNQNEISFHGVPTQAGIGEITATAVIESEKGTEQCQIMFILVAKREVMSSLP